MSDDDQGRCPFCGIGYNQHWQHDPTGRNAEWACGSFKHGEKAQQSVDCKLNVAAQRIAALEAENARLRESSKAAVALADAALEGDDLEREAWASVSDTGHLPLSERHRRAEDHERRLHANSARLTLARAAYRAACAEKGEDDAT